MNVNEPIATVVAGNTFTLDSRYDFSKSKILGNLLFITNIILCFK